MRALYCGLLGCKALKLFHLISHTGFPNPPLSWFMVCLIFILSLLLKQWAYSGTTDFNLKIWRIRHQNIICFLWIACTWIYYLSSSEINWYLYQYYLTNELEKLFPTLKSWTVFMVRSKSKLSRFKGCTLIQNFLHTIFTLYISFYDFITFSYVHNLLDEIIYMFHVAGQCSLHQFYCLSFFSFISFHRLAYMMKVVFMPFFLKQRYDLTI